MLLALEKQSRVLIVHSYSLYFLFLGTDWCWLECGCVLEKSHPFISYALLIEPLFFGGTISSSLSQARESQGGGGQHLRCLRLSRRRSVFLQLGGSILSSCFHTPLTLSSSFPVYLFLQCFGAPHFVQMKY